MAHRSPARWLAPLALVAFVVALFAVLGASSGGGDGSDDSTPANQTRPAGGTGGGSAEAPEEDSSERSRKSYTVRLGDTPSQIASENGITLEQLERLNPDLDPQLLNPGEKVRIRK